MSSPLPSHVFAQVTKAWARQDYGLGEELLAEACARNPGHNHLRICHAAALGYCGRYSAARTAFEALLDETPPERMLHMQALIGIEWCRIGRHDLAIPLLQAALDGPDPAAPVFQALADALLRLRKRSLDTLDLGLSRHPNHPGLLVLKARALRLEGDAERAVATAQQVAGALTATSETKAEAWHEMGHALDALARYRDAFSAFHSAKLALRPQAERFLPLWEAQQKVFSRFDDQPTRTDYERWADSPRPPLEGRVAFLIGLPRSGTTLLERVLDAHPSIAAASEVPVFNNVWRRLLRLNSGSTRYMDLLDGLGCADLQDFRTRYAADIQQAIEQPFLDHLVLDKNPSSTPYGPAILRFFPNAKLLMALRNPRAVAWSCFAQYLPLNSESAAFNRLSTLGIHIASTLRFWLHTRSQLLSGTWRECRYEAMVSNTETEARQILEFLDLPWDRAVLNHHSSPTSVRSPSYAQASQPIYSHALENWRHYEEFMGDAFAALDEVMGEFGYD